MFNNKPVAMADLMVLIDEFWYCPFVFCYSNYSRTSYTPYLLEYVDVITSNSKKLSTTIGGISMSMTVSANNQQPERAVKFAKMVCSTDWHSGIYVQKLRSVWPISSLGKHIGNQYTNIFYEYITGYVK